ncbi:dermonecrotic toxin domain-containing protein [Pseudomonas guariconensis]|uniref:dermonecrotic toxin domain-containing protein n=1 Tax=Pseudomonas guariconensis TaxID=1288410 RepID=UPI002B061006|nr:DUF6543 domain-containing protein [Pseudomonas guariconensis]
MTERHIFQDFSNEVTASRHETGEPLLLKDFVSQQAVDYPSPRKFSHDVAKAYVLQMLELDIDPDELFITTLYIDAWDEGDQRANIASSMTLTDALMRNWQQQGDGSLFSHLGTLEDFRLEGYPTVIAEAPLPLDDCFAYEAIYRKTTPQRFSSDTQVRLDPKSFKRFAWEVDLQAKYLKHLNEFWRSHERGYNLLIKASMLRAAFVQHEEGSLTLSDKQMVLRAMGLPASSAWETLTYEVFEQGALDQEIVSIRELLVYRYTASDIIVFKDEQSGRLVVYIPGNSSPLHGFEDMAAFCDWFALQCRFTQRRTVLEGHFKAEDDPDGIFVSGLKTVLLGLGAFPSWHVGNYSRWNPHDEITLGPAIHPWPFTHFKNNLKSRLQSDALRLIRSRAAYNQALAGEVLSTALTVTSIVAMAVPALWLPVAAMSAALIGLGADEVANSTVEDQAQGKRRIIFGILNAVPATLEIAKVAGAAARIGDAVAPGAADEIGQKASTLTPQEQVENAATTEQLEQELANQREEHASESTDERRVRREHEEAQRLARAKLHAQTFDSVKAFGIEPDGLRSLSPQLREELAKFEYNAPLGDGGKWVVDDFGAVYQETDEASGAIRRYARVHAKLYRVERIERAGQYRIISSNEANIEGPYLKRLKGFYSDIDVKPGLRGGESLIEVAPDTEPAPDVLKPGITLVRAHPLVQIEVPMDGIEIRPAFEEEQQIDTYYAMNTARGTRVTFDADIGGWKSYDGKVHWLNNKGVWKQGSVKSFLAVRSSLRFGVRYEVYTFPRIPGISQEARAINREVHQIWLGTQGPRTGLIDTMKANIRANPSLKFTLHLDVDNAAFTGELDRLKQAFAEFPNMAVSELGDEPFFSRFLTDDETVVPYRYFRSGQGQNLAAASDILRYRLIHEYGGIYMDCDDVMVGSFEAVELNAGPDDVLTGGAVSSPRMGFYGPGNSHFASHAGNPVLQEIQQAAYRRWIDEIDALRELEASRTVGADGTNPYMRKIFAISGPQMFLDTLKRLRADYADLLDDVLKPRAGMRSLTYLEFRDAAIDFYAPFGRRLKIRAGAENSWSSTAAQASH